MVKIEDHPSKDEPSIMANYQGDRCMGPHGVMYLVVENPKRVGPYGELISRPKIDHEMGKEEERPPKVSHEDMHLINSLRVMGVPIDDNAKALYSRDKEKELNLYLGHH